MIPDTERRRSRRFLEDSISARVSVLDRDALQIDPCVLVNLSFGGMCAETRQELREGQIYAFLLDLQAPFHDLVMVKARVLWVRLSGAQRVFGAEFTESTKGWLGPDE